MSTSAFVFMVIGVATVTSWLFKIIDRIERGKRHERKRAL